MKAHLLIFDNENISLKRMIEIVDAMPTIANWHVIFANTICIASEASAKELAGVFSPMLPGIRYLISEVRAQDKGGRMNMSILALLNAPAAAEPEPA